MGKIGFGVDVGIDGDLLDEMRRSERDFPAFLAELKPAAREKVVKRMMKNRAFQPLPRAERGLVVPTAIAAGYTRPFRTGVCRALKVNRSWAGRFITEMVPHTFVSAKETALAMALDVRYPVWGQDASSVIFHEKAFMGWLSDHTSEPLQQVVPMPASAVIAPENLDGWRTARARVADLAVIASGAARKQVERVLELDAELGDRPEAEGLFQFLAKKEEDEAKDAQVAYARAMSRLEADVADFLGDRGKALLRKGRGEFMDARSDVPFVPSLTLSKDEAMGLMSSGEGWTTAESMLDYGDVSETLYRGMFAGGWSRIDLTCADKDGEEGHKSFWLPPAWRVRGDEVMVRGEDGEETEAPEVFLLVQAGRIADVIGETAFSEMLEPVPNKFMLA